MPLPPPCSLPSPAAARPHQPPPYRPYLLQTLFVAPPPLVLRAAFVQWRLLCSGLLCLACFAWLALLGLCWVQAAEALACAARLQPRAKMGGLQLLLACAACLRPRAKMGGVQWSSLFSACIAGGTGLSCGGAAALALLALLGFHLSAFGGCWG